MRVTLRRGTETVTASWVPLDDFSAHQTVLYGLTMQKLNGQPWEVLDVRKDSPADRAGLRVGDRIPSLEPFAYQTPDSPGQVSLSVTRAGQATPLAVTLAAPPADTGVRSRTP